MLRSLLTLAYLETNGQLTLRLLYPHGSSVYSLNWGLGETTSLSGSCGQNYFITVESETKICHLSSQYRTCFTSCLSCGDINRRFLSCKDSKPWCPTRDTSLECLVYRSPLLLKLILERSLYLCKMYWIQVPLLAAVLRFPLSQ